VVAIRLWPGWEVDSGNSGGTHAREYAWTGTSAEVFGLRSGPY
jgi:hypothetical protein